MYVDKAAVIGFTAGRVRWLFPSTSRDWLVGRTPDAFTPSSFSLVMLSSSECLLFHHRSFLSRRATTYLGFCPHSTSPQLVHDCGGSQPSARFRSQVFSTSQRFTPSCGLRVYSTSLPSPGLTCTGIYPLCIATLFSSNRSPSLPLAQNPLSPPKGKVHESRARLRGFDPYKATCRLR